jgi:hypothetical protein
MVLRTGRAPGSAVSPWTVHSKQIMSLSRPQVADVRSIWRCVCYDIGGRHIAVRHPRGGVSVPG